MVKSEILIDYSSPFAHPVDLDEVVRAVCIGGNCYSKFEHDVIRYFSEETNEKILRLLNELDVMQRMMDVGNKKLTETYKLSLKYLGKDLGLHDETIREIIDWQQRRLSLIGHGMILLVVAANSSMKGLTPLRISKEDFIGNEIKKMISRFKSYKYEDWNNLTLSIINYATIAKYHTWPTRLQNIDEIKIDIKATEEKAVRISEGLEAAMQIIQMLEGKTYLILVSDGQDDDAERTKKIIDEIKHKWEIEFYSYYVESSHSDTSQREAFNLIGGIPLSDSLEQTVDWWITRDVLPHPWYEQECWYKQELESVPGA